LIFIKNKKLNNFIIKFY